jgi:hypothetical protein
MFVYGRHASTQWWCCSYGLWWVFRTSGFDFLVSSGSRTRCIKLHIIDFAEKKRSCSMLKLMTKFLWSLMKRAKNQNITSFDAHPSNIVIQKIRMPTKHYPSILMIPREKSINPIKIERLYMIKIYMKGWDFTNVRLFISS